jgi:hypothetical protein
MNKEEEVQKLLDEGMSMQEIIEYYQSIDDTAGIATAYDVQEWPMAY